MSKGGEEIGNCRPEDVAWLSTLSESEIDLLVGLKKLAIQRASVIDKVDLAEKFDLRTLRVLGCVLIEHLKGRLQSAPELSSSAEVSACLNKCGLTSWSRPDELGSATTVDRETSAGRERQR